jgi:hypothetical protein
MYYAIRRGDSCTIFDATDGSVFKQFPDLENEDHVGYEVVRCYASYNHLGIWATNGEDTIF